MNDKRERMTYEKQHELYSRIVHDEQCKGEDDHFLSSLCRMSRLNVLIDEFFVKQLTL